MSKGGLVLGVINLIAVIALFVMMPKSGEQPQQSGNSVEVVASTSTGASSGLKGKVGIIHNDSLIAKAEIYIQSRKEMDAEAERFTRKANALRQEYQEKMNAYQIQAQTTQMSMEEINAMQEEATQYEKGVQDRMMAMQQEEQRLSESQLQRTQELTEQVYDVITAYAEEQGLEMVLFYTDLGGSVIYAAEYFDITDAIVEDLNEQLTPEK